MMSTYILDWAAFIIVTVVFARLGFKSRHAVQSVNQYFHNPSFWKNVISLVATDITIGTGIVYLISGAGQHGALMLLVPISTYVGYHFQAAAIDRWLPKSTKSGRNVLSSLNEEITLARDRNSIFAKSLSIVLVSVFTFLLAFEIFASAKVIAPLLWRSPTPLHNALISMIVFCITISYAILGGVNALIGVDKIMVPLILLFLPVFIVATVPDWQNVTSISERLAASIRFDTQSVVTTMLACVAAISTQFYSILNWGTLSNVEATNQGRFLRRVGLLSCIVLLVFVIVGLLQSGHGSTAWADVASKFVSLPEQSDMLAKLMSVVATLGFASILLSTTDAVVVHSIMFWFDNVLGKDSKSVSDSPAELKTIKVIGFLAFTFSFVILAVLNYFNPDPFYLLLSMAGGVSALTPFIILVMILSKWPQRLNLISNTVILFFLGIVACSGILNAYYLAVQSPVVAYIGAYSFCASSVSAMALWFWAKRLYPLSS